MANMLKRLGSLALALIMVLSLVPVNTNHVHAAATEISTEAQLIKALNDGGSYILTADIEATGGLTNKKSTTIDFNGHTIKLSNDTVNSNNEKCGLLMNSSSAHLTLTDTSSKKNGGFRGDFTSATSYAIRNKGAKLTINGGEHKFTRTSGSHAVYFWGTLNMNGGTLSLENKGTGYMNTIQTDTGTLNVDGGKISAITNGSGSISAVRVNRGKVNMNNGEILAETTSTGSVNAIHIEVATSKTNKDYAAHMASNKVLSITGGTVKATATGSTAGASAVKVAGAENVCTLSVSGGELIAEIKDATNGNPYAFYHTGKGHLTISGGTLTAINNNSAKRMPMGLYLGNAATLDITGGTVEAVNNAVENACGIYYVGTGDISISGNATVKAKAGNNSYAIRYYQSDITTAGKVTINGGLIRASHHVLHNAPTGTNAPVITGGRYIAYDDETVRDVTNYLAAGYCQDAQGYVFKDEHQYYEKAGGQAPTCTEDGVVDYYKCQYCDYHFYLEGETRVEIENLTEWLAGDGVIDMLGHSFSGAGSLCANGCGMVACSEGHTKGELIPFQAHTCDENGHIAHYICTICGTYMNEQEEEVDYATEVVIPAAHTAIEFTAQVDPTFDTTGTEAYWYCEGCQRYYAGTADQVGDEIAAPVVIPQVGVVATIGEERFADLQAAVDAAAEGAVIVVQSDICLAEFVLIAADDKLTIDLNGKHLTAVEVEAGKHSYTFSNEGDLTLMDSVGTGSVSGRGINNNEKLTILSGNYNALDTSGGACVYQNASNTTLTIEGGTFNSALYALTVKQGTATINGGTFFGESRVATIEGGTVTVNGGTFDSKSTTLFVGSGTLNVKGGTISNAVGQYTINNEGGTLNISGGTIEISGVADRDRDAIRVGSGRKANITGGTIKVSLAKGTAADAGSKSVRALRSLGTTTIKNAVFDVVSRDQTGGNSGAIYVTGGTCTISNTVINTDSDQKSDGNPYAINAYGGTVTINAGTEVYSKSVNREQATIFAQQNGNVIINGGTFTAENTTTAAHALRNVSSNAKITVNGGTFTAFGGSASTAVAYASGGPIEFNGGVFEGAQLFRNPAADKVNIHGGTFIDTNATSIDVSDFYVQPGEDVTKPVVAEVTYAAEPNKITVCDEVNDFATAVNTYGADGKAKITLLNDVTDSGKNGFNYTFELDMNGKTWIQTSGSAMQIDGVGSEKKVTYIHNGYLLSKDTSCVSVQIGALHMDGVVTYGADAMPVCYSNIGSDYNADNLIENCTLIGNRYFVFSFRKNTGNQGDVEMIFRNTNLVNTYHDVDTSSASVFLDGGNGTTGKYILDENVRIYTLRTKSYSSGLLDSQVVFTDGHAEHKTAAAQYEEINNILATIGEKLNYKEGDLVCVREDGTTGYGKWTAAPDLTMWTTEHTYGDATCEEGPKCSCGAVNGEPNGHAWTAKEAKDATCTAKGNVAYFDCDNCELFAVEVNGEKVITAWAEIETDFAEHTYGETWTCGNDGTHFKDCSVCGAARISQNCADYGVSFGEKAPTCTESGFKAGTKCSVCDYVIKGTETDPALGHDFENGTVTDEFAGNCQTESYVTTKCSRCDATETVKGAKNPAVHTNLVKDKAVDATCTATGLTEGEHCADCGTVTKAQTATPKLGHDFENGTVTEEFAGNCQTESYVTTQCIRCDATETVKGAKNPAVHTNLVEDKAVAATCTTTGLTKGEHCADCGVVTTAQTETPKLGHDFENGTVIDEFAGNCQTESFVTTKCARCDVTETVYGAKNMDVHTDLVKDDAVDATCTATGLTEGEHCAACNTVTKAQTETPALGHDFENGTVTEEFAGNCQTESFVTTKCARCDVTETVTGAKNPAVHTNLVKDDAVAATCTATGLTEGEHCGACGTVTKAQTETPALDHNFENGTVTEEFAGNCQTESFVTTKCARCDVTETVTGEKNMNVHTNLVKDDAVAATCTATGLTEGEHCADCGTVTKAQTETPALEHVFTYTSNGDKKTHTIGCERGDYTATADCVDADNNKVCDLCEQKLIEPMVLVNGDEYETLAEAWAVIKDGDTVTLMKDISATEIITINKAITLDGNGKKLTSTAGRAINIETEGNVTIKNLTIEAKGERAINIINLPATVAIENVTATAKNYAIMMATSATAADLTVKNSNLTGLAVVNVASADSVVEIENTKITNLDATSAENYGAISIFKTAENTKVTVKGGEIVLGDDSVAASNGAEDANVTFEGTVGAEKVQTVVAYIGDAGYTSLQSAINDAKAGQTITLIRDVTAKDIITINKGITLDGNGKTLTSTAGRAINVNCAGDVTIKNLTINSTGERAINVITQPANLTVDNVTATATHYTVNLAGSAAGATVAVKNSNLTGLNVVNVAAKNANVTVDNTTLNVVDNAPTEGYSALVLNKDAVGATLAATNVTFNITGTACDDTDKASNQAENGTVTIDGSTEGVTVDVAYILYGTTWYGFETLEAAIEKAVEGETIVLIRDVTAKDIITINKGITLDGNGKTLTSTAGRAINIETEGNVTIKNLTIEAKGERAINIINLPATVAIENVTATAKNYAIMMATSATAADLTVKNSNLTGLAVVNVASADSVVEIENTKITNLDATSAENYGAISIFKTAENTKVTVKGGEIVLGDDSVAASNGAEGANVTFEGTVGAEKVQTVVAYIGDAGYTSLQSAINDAKAGQTVTLIRDVTAKDIITINKAITLDGNGKTLTSTAGRAINIDCAGEVTINDLTIVGGTGCERGINVINKAGTTNLNNLTISGVSHYAVHVATSANAAKVNIADSELSGWAAVAAYGNGTVVNVENSALVGINTYSGNTDAFATVSAGTNVTINVTGGSITAITQSGKAPQYIACTMEDVTGATFVLDTELNFAEADGIINTNVEANAIAVRETYAQQILLEGYMPESAGAGMVAPGEAAVAAVNGQGYTTLQDALDAAEEQGEATVVLVSDLELKSHILVYMGVTLDLNGHSLTTTKTFTVYGDVIDGAEGGYGLVKASKAHIEGTKSYLPVYDTAEGGYRFYAYELKNLSYKADGTTITFAIRLNLNNADGYRVLATTAESELDKYLQVHAHVSWTGLNGELDYIFKASTVIEYAKQAADAVASTGTHKKVIKLVVSGLDKLSVAGSMITMTPAVTTNVGVNVRGTQAQTYTVQ